MATMYTRCPECKQQVTVSAEQLRKTHGMLRCEQCGILFDALESISDQPDAGDVAAEPAFSIADEAPSNKSGMFGWWVACLCASVLLIGQVLYFEGDRLVQNHLLRPWLQRACEALDCSLPAYRNLAELSILNSQIRSQDKKQTVFKLILLNQADFPQPYPKLKLTLMNYAGQPFAERIFSAEQYQHPAGDLKANQTVEIKLEIINPSARIGGYFFSLV